ncbi:MAG: hypothetical protein V2I57_12610 [Xanthomonadales bacterium]|jgi:hypothetical protein|nr:hypothetical protein [Xanthomonadales bacterium]
MNTRRIGGLAALLGAVLALAPFGSEAQEAIGVSGFWKITVSAADGSNPEVYQFNNALVDGGGEYLENLLGTIVSSTAPIDAACVGVTCPLGQVCYAGGCYTSCAPGDVYCTPPPPPCPTGSTPLEAGSVSAAIGIQEGLYENPFRLPASVDTNGIFRASWIADRDITIRFVSTFLQTVENGCVIAAGPGTPLTQKDTTPIAVLSGQLVNIEVDISFATLTP